MSSFLEISVSFLVIIIIIALFKIYYIYKYVPCKYSKIAKDALVTHEDLHNAIKENITERCTTPTDLYNTLVSGIVRGAITGYLINGVEGAVVTAFMLGSVNIAIEGL